MSNQRSSPSGKGWHPPHGTITTSPLVGRFENEPATTTLYIKGSPAKFTDNDGRKSIAPYSNHGQLSPQQRSSGIVGLRTAPNSESKDEANWGSHDQQATTVSIACFILLSYQNFLVKVSCELQEHVELRGQNIVNYWIFVVCNSNSLALSTMWFGCLAAREVRKT